MADRTQRVIWTALPTGRVDGFLTLTALASPRLALIGADLDLLKGWPDFIDWPAKVRNARFVVTFAGAQARAERLSEPDSTTWGALFTGETTVRGHKFEDRRGTAILSFPVTRVHDFVGEVYGDLGLQAGDELPEKRDVLRPLFELARGSDEKRDLQGEVLRILRSKARQALGDVRGAFTLQEVYNMPLAARDPQGGHHAKQGDADPREEAAWRQHRFVDMPKPTELAERIDFHAIVSALNQYPGLLRLTGLTVDLRVRASALPAGPLSDTLSLEVTWTPGSEAQTGVETLEDGRPQTVTRRDDPHFFAVPRSPGSPIKDGLLAIDDKRFRLIQMDVDGAGIKLRNTARSFLRSASQRDDRPDPGGVPALRTAGLQLVEVDRHLSLDDAFTRSGDMNDALEQGTPVVLHAEDLMRGYHVDVLDQTIAAPWRSLCRRDGTFDFLSTGAQLNIEDEEGIVRLGAQEAADPDDPQFKDLVKIGELLFSWTGWSLTAPRVGLAIGTDDKPRPSENTAPPGLPMESDFTVRQGSLPPQRFGHEYRVRVRLVDLAGNALPFRDGDTEVSQGVSNPQVFRRFEPVSPPANALVDGPAGLERPFDGESMARLAIRSMNDTEADNAVPTAAEARRHIVPPRTSHVMAEQHGMLDAAAGRPDPTLYAMLAARDQNLAEAKVLHEDPVTGSSDLLGYSVGPENLTTPYLPDAIALAAAVRLEFEPRQGPPQRVEVSYYDGTAWPDAQPFKLRIFEDASAALAFDPTTRTLNIPLAKSEMMRLRISHLLKSEHLDQMAVWDLIRGRPGITPSLAARLQGMAESGEHWMLTPWLEMELIHAVQKPLVRPAFLNLSATRVLGATAATILYRTPVHAKSTDKLELGGRWTEPSDIPAEGAPRVLNQSGPAFEKRLGRDSAPAGEIRVQGPHAFGDTRFRRVTYRLDAPTRFREFMPAVIRSDPLRTKVTSDDGVALVPNAAVPPAPEVVEVTPTFGWSRSTVGTSVSSFRSGGGLRVWLRRPWFVTGFGEMLGVLVATEGATREQITGPLAKFVTQWGADPIWRSGTIAAASPPSTAFAARLNGGPIPAESSPAFVPADELLLPNPFPALSNLVVPESGGAHVNVASHPVQYDQGRDQYFCDILVRPGSSYFPFVRLALARFHPVSVAGAHLSPAVIGDYMQLAPDRLLRMSSSRRTGLRKLQLYGHSYSRSPLTEERPRLDARPVIRTEMQRRNPALKGDVAWERVEKAPIDPIRLQPILRVSEAPLLRFDPAELGDGHSPVALANLDIFTSLGPPLMWETTFRVPRIGKGEEWRVLVMEYERHSIDTDRPKRDEEAFDPSLRLVYAEALPL